MTRKTWMFLTLILVLGGASLYLNRDWFAKDTIQIYHRSRPARFSVFSRSRSKRPPPPPSEINPITFGFSRKLRLTEVKVIPLSDIQTNKYPHPIWHLTTESNSVPVKDFIYGSSIPGMHPSIKGAQPDSLIPGVPYRLYVQAGEFKAEHDFTPVPRTP